MATTMHFYAVSGIGVDTPPTIVDGEHWISGPTGSTPDGAWAGLVPPFLASGDTTTSEWQTQQLQDGAIYLELTTGQPWVYDPTSGWLKALAGPHASLLKRIEDEDYEVEPHVRTVICGTTGASSFDITLPDITEIVDGSERQLDIIFTQKGSTGTYTITPHTGQRIAGATSYGFLSVRDSVQLVSDRNTSPENWQPRFYSGAPFRMNELSGGTAGVDIETSANVEASGDVVAVGDVIAETEMETDSIREHTAAAGVEVDGVLLKDERVHSLNTWPWRASRQYAGDIVGATVSSTSTAGSGNIVYTRITVPNQITVTAVQSQVTTATASSNCRMALYADDGTGEPGDLIAGSGDIATTSTGVKTFTLTTAAALVPGVYWTGLRCSSASVIFLAVATTEMRGSLGTTTGAASLAAMQVARTETGTFGAFPSTAAPTGFSSAATPVTTLVT